MSKRHPSKQFYMPRDFEATYEEIAKFCKQEGYSMSRVIRGLLLKWWDEHRPGNPQLLLDTFAEGHAHQDKPPPCHHVVKSTGDAVYCRWIGYGWISLKRCWRCWRRRSQQP